MSLILKRVSPLLIAFLVALSVSVDANAFEPGEQATDFTLPGKTGVLKLSDMKGSVIYLDFWASWCGPCRQSFPWMNRIQAKFKDKGFRVLAVNLDAKTDQAMKFLSQVPADFTVAFDSKGQTSRVYGVKGMPTSVLIDRSGKVLWQHAGFNSADTQELEQKIQAALEAR